MTQMQRELGAVSPGQRPDFDAIPVCEIKTAAQFRAIASPVRDQIVGVVAALTSTSPDGETRGVSIREIAEEMGRKPASLYRHLDALLEAGIISEVGAEPSGGREATTYAIPAGGSCS